MRRYEDFGNRARGGPLEFRRYGCDCILMCCHKLRVRSTSNDSHHAIASLPTVSVRAQLRDFAGKLKPGNVLRSTRRRSISTRPLQQICAIQRGTPHANENFLSRRVWFRYVLDFQDLRPTETSDDNSFHGLVGWHIFVQSQID